MCCAERQRGLEADGGEEAEDPGLHVWGLFAVDYVFIFLI